MSNVHWESILDQIDDRYIQEAVRSYELPRSATISHRRKEHLFMRSNTKHRGFMRVGALAAAIALIFTFGLTAYAAGVFDSVIAKMTNAYAVPDEARDARYEAAAEVSNKEQETVNLSQLLGNAITMEESYYDGTELMLVYSLDSLQYPVEFDVDADDERFAGLKSWIPWEWIGSAANLPFRMQTTSRFAVPLKKAEKSALSSGKLNWATTLF